MANCTKRFNETGLYARKTRICVSLSEQKRIAVIGAKNIRTGVSTKGLMFFSLISRGLI